MTRTFFFALVVCAVALTGAPQAVASAGPQKEILEAMKLCANNWNAGDMEGFVSFYKRSPDIVLVGPHSLVGFARVRAYYLKAYSTSEARGTLTYSQLQVQPLDRRLATLTGHFHLERDRAGGGNQDGYFLVVFEHTAAGWKMVRD